MSPTSEPPSAEKIADEWLPVVAAAADDIAAVARELRDRGVLQRVRGRTRGMHGVMLGTAGLRNDPPASCIQHPTSAMHP